MSSLEEMREVYHMLSDEESRFTWLNRMNYLVTDDFAYMDAIIDSYLPEFSGLSNKTVQDVLSRIPQGRGFVLFGAGGAGAMFYSYFKQDKRFCGFCSSTVAKQRNGFCGCLVMSPEELAARKDLTVIVSAHKKTGEILDILSDIGYPKDLIFTSDDFHFHCNEQYFGPDFIRYEAEEVFVDAGCFDLRSSLDLREKCGKLSKVYAFEPDPESYKVCQENKEKYHFPEAEILPFGVWSESKELHFVPDLGEASHVGDRGNGNISVSVKSIDGVVDRKKKVTFIKMDIEGSELEALKGAKHTIQRDNPKLAICIYHKPEDMTEIPLYIKSLVPEYAFYVRHHTNYNCDTVLYAILP